MIKSYRMIKLRIKSHRSLNRQRIESLTLKERISKFRRENRREDAEGDIRLKWSGDFNCFFWLFYCLVFSVMKSAVSNSYQRMSMNRRKWTCRFSAKWWLTRICLPKNKRKLSWRSSSFTLITLQDRAKSTKKDRNTYPPWWRNSSNRRTKPMKISTSPWITPSRNHSPEYQCVEINSLFLQIQFWIDLVNADSFEKQQEKKVLHR